MNFQQIFENSESVAVAVLVGLFVVFHFGVVYLLG